MAEAKRSSRMSLHRHCRKIEENLPPTPPPWVSLKGLFFSNHHRRHHTPDRTKKKQHQHGKFRCSISICNTRDASNTTRCNTRRGAKSSQMGTFDSQGCGSRNTPLKEINGPHSFSSASSCITTANSSSSIGGPLKGGQLRRLYGCYQCHSVVDPIGGISREASLRPSISSCSDCGQMFMKSESLELHQAARHAVTELGPEDTSRNIVEIIFQSSWLKRPSCKIDRILKINNTHKTISRFEDYRDLIRMRSTQLKLKYPRCTADGNELLRFYPTTFTCSIGLEGSTSLCCSIPSCKTCAIIRDGFKANTSGRIRTMATSGRAHEAISVSSVQEKRAMLVCRVIAGRISKSHDSLEECDSITGPYSTLDELFLFNARAILPCFLVIYREKFS